MKRVHESVDYIRHPERKMQQYYKNFPVRSTFPPLHEFKSVDFEGFSFVKKNTSGQYTVFKIRISADKSSWAIFRRYSEFANLYENLSKEYEVPILPPKRLFGHFATEFLLRRQADLESWLSRVLHDSDETGVLSNPYMHEFLTRDLTEIAGLGMFSPSVVVSVPKPSTSSASSSLSQEKIITKSNLAQEVLPNDSDDELNDVIAELSTSIDRREREHNRYVPNKKPGLEDFEMVRVLGKGSFGKVVLCRKKDTGKLYAIKILKKKHVLKKKQLRHAKTERSVLGYLDHPFIVKLHYAFQTGDKLHFVLDYLQGGELFFHLGKSGRFDEKLGRFYAAEISLALGYLHSHKIVYRDLKPENILLDADGHIKLADFGLSKEGINSGTEGTHSFCGTPEYLAPEVLNRSGHGTAVDWWSLGALLYEMLSGLPPWYSQDRRKMFAAIRKSELRFPSYMSVAAKAILEALLDKDATSRLGSTGDLEEVKEHPFFDSINWEALLRKEIVSPFIPKIEQNGDLSNPDTRNFDTCFTRLPVHSHIEDPSSMTSNASLSKLGPSINSLANAFNGFTFIEPSHLKEKTEHEVEEEATQQKSEEQILLEQQILNLHEPVLPNVGTGTSPSGLSSSLLFK